MSKSFTTSLIVGTILALMLACTVAASAQARRTPINMSQVKGKAKARASKHCSLTENAGFRCLADSIQADDCRRQSLQRPDVGWCWASHISQDRAPGPRQYAYYLFTSLTWGKSIDNKIHWRLFGWSASLLPEG